MSAQNNRRDFPRFAAWLDEFVRVFGPMRVKWVCEDGKTIGNVPEEFRVKEKNEDHAL